MRDVIRQAKFGFDTWDRAYDRTTVDRRRQLLPPRFAVRTGRRAAAWIWHCGTYTVCRLIAVGGGRMPLAAVERVRERVRMRMRMRMRMRVYACE